MGWASRDLSLDARKARATISRSDERPRLVEYRRASDEAPSRIRDSKSGIWETKAEPRLEHDWSRAPEDNEGREMSADEDGDGNRQTALTRRAENFWRVSRAARNCNSPNLGSQRLVGAHSTEQDG